MLNMMWKSHLSFTREWNVVFWMMWWRIFERKRSSTRYNLFLEKNKFNVIFELRYITWNIIQPQWLFMYDQYLMILYYINYIINYIRTLYIIVLAIQWYITIINVPTGLNGGKENCNNLVIVKMIQNPFFP